MLTTRTSQLQKLVQHSCVFVFAMMLSCQGTTHFAAVTRMETHGRADTSIGRFVYFDTAAGQPVFETAREAAQFDDGGEGAIYFVSGTATAHEVEYFGASAMASVSAAAAWDSPTSGHFNYSDSWFATDTPGGVGNPDTPYHSAVETRFRWDSDFVSDFDGTLIATYNISGQEAGVVVAGHSASISNGQASLSGVVVARVHQGEPYHLGVDINNRSAGTLARSGGSDGRMQWAIQPKDGASLVFREKEAVDSWFKGNDATTGIDIPGWDHVALNYASRIYESSWKIPAGTYIDPTGGPPSVVANDISGVLQVHSLETFVHNSTDEVTSTRFVRSVPIPVDIAAAMRDKVASQIGSEYPGPLDSLRSFIFEPGLQKGTNGKFTCVGIIEWAAEQVGEQFESEPLLYGKEGFVPDKYETRTIETEIVVPALPQLPFEIHIPIAVTVNNLSPSLMEYFVTNPGIESDAFFQGLFDPVDFIVTDPLGRRVGHTQTLGKLNEIPGVFYTGDGEVEELLILNAVAGNYRVELFGTGENVFAAFGSGGEANAKMVNSVIAPGQVVTTFVMVVPEPPSIVVFGVALPLLLWHLVNARRGSSAA